MRRIPVWCLALVTLIPASATAAPNDPYYEAGLQWGLPKVGAENAWTVSRGQGSVVAVLDTGIDLEHPDLEGRLVPGADFVDADDGDDPPVDENGHGTLVGGIVAAATANGRGVASVAPLARLMPVRVLDSDGGGSTEDVAEGIRWAVEHGAHVINLSLAQESDGERTLAERLLAGPDVDDAIRDAVTAGATVVIAAGNDHAGGRSETSYDSTVEGALVVGASTRDDRAAAFSNHGVGLDLIAPGGGSPTDPKRSACKQSNFIVSTWWNPETERSVYGGGCGTSMAVGFVSAAAALLRTQGLSNVEIARRIVDSARDLGEPGRDDLTGYGRLDVARALGARAPAKPGSSRAAAVTKNGTVVEPTLNPSQRAVASARARASRPETGRRSTSGEIAAPSGRRAPERGPVRTAAALAAVVATAHLARLKGTRRRARVRIPRDAGSARPLL